MINILSENTKIGPVLDVAVSYHQGRYGVEIMINSLFSDGTRPWVKIVNGINKYETEMSEETHIDDINESTGKAAPKTISKQLPSSTVSSAMIPVPYHVKKMDRRRTRRIQQKLSGNIDIDDLIAAT